MLAWPLKPVSCHQSMGFEQVTSVLKCIGEADGAGLGTELFNMVSARVPLEICTVMAYESGTRVYPLSHAGRVRERAITDTISTYVRNNFVSLDGIQHVIASHKGKATGAPEIWCQRMATEEIASEQYRSLCYDRPGICERLAILSHYEGQRWLSIKFYRGRQYGPFGDQEIEQLEAFAPLAAQAVRLFYSNYLHRNRLGDVLLDRLDRACPGLSGRERDLIAGILEGRSTTEIAADMGIKEMTLRSYQKRLYRKLGISSQRELLPLCTSA